MEIAVAAITLIAIAVIMLIAIRRAHQEVLAGRLNAVGGLWYHLVGTKHHDRIHDLEGAEDALRRGDTEEAVDLLEESSDAVWNVCVADGDRFGSFDALEGLITELKTGGLPVEERPLAANPIPYRLSPDEEDFIDAAMEEAAYLSRLSDEEKVIYRILKESDPGEGRPLFKDDGLPF